MSRPTLEVADIFRDDGPAWRAANAGHVSLDQMKVMTAIERCRTAALGGHVARCENDVCGDGPLNFYGEYAGLAERAAFDAFLKPTRKIKWYVNIKDPFAGPKTVLAYLSRYTHRIAISNRRLVRNDANGVAFRYKDYRVDGRARYKTMTLEAHEFIRRFLIHVLPKGLHRIRHYGLFANGNRAANIARARELLNVPTPSNDDADGTTAEPDQPQVLNFPCPSCGGRMIIIEVFASGMEPKQWPSPEAIDSS